MTEEKCRVVSENHGSRDAVLGDLRYTAGSRDHSASSASASSKHTRGRLFLSICVAEMASSSIGAARAPDEGVLRARTP